MLNRLSIKTKLVLMLLSVGLISTLVVGILGWWNSRSALTAASFEQINSIRRSKADEVVAYFSNMRHTVEVLSQNDMVVEAMVRFNRAFNQLENQVIPSEWDMALETYYTAQFFPQLFANLPGQADYTLYRPENQAGFYLQYQYIAANPHPDGEKLLLDQAKDGSEYSEVHAYYHPRLRSLVQKLGYDDLILINLETGDVIYTVAKQTDFASNLDLGPYRRSNETDALELVRDNPERGVAHLVDFELYRPGYGAPAAFWAAPLYNGAHLVGALLIQLSPDELNQIMTYRQNWTNVGLRQTGETYLVGPDLLMRSSARFLVEDPEGYRATLQDLGLPTENINLIEKFSTTMLLQNVTSQADNAAIQNEEGAELSTDYRRVPALISYQPIVLEGLQWGLIAKMDRDEVFAPFYAFQRQLMISAALIIALLAFASVAIAYLFMRPVNLLLEGARRVDTGDNAMAINLQTRDELGELATSLNGMMHDIRQQSAALEQKNQEVTHLLLNVLPSAAARRLQNGETGIIDQVQQVTLLSGRVQGLDELALRKEAQEVADLLQDLAVDLDEAADRHDVEKLSIVGQRFLGICGLSTPHLDHSRRTADFALAVAQIVDRLNTKYGANLNLRAGIHTGPVTAGVIGVNKVLYEMWGETINIARALVEDAGPNMILVSQAIYERLRDQFVFRRLREAGHDTSRAGAWVLEGVATPATGQPASVAESSPHARAVVR